MVKICHLIYYWVAKYIIVCLCVLMCMWAVHHIIRNLIVFSTDAQYVAQISPHLLCIEYAEQDSRVSWKTLSETSILAPLASLMRSYNAGGRTIESAYPVICCVSNASRYSSPIFGSVLSFSHNTNSSQLHWSILLSAIMRWAWHD